LRLDSTAVMQRRHESLDSLDDFPTPPWATRALGEFLRSRDLITSGMICREPAANRGYMARTLEEYFDKVVASDVEDYGCGYPVRNYLTDEFKTVDWTITNPPFVLAKDFINKALDTSKAGVATILRIAFLEGKARYRELFSINPPSHVLQFVERVPMVKGKYDPEASSATAYAWFVWQQDAVGTTELHWIPPCKEGLINPEKDFIE
jgi:hypothetical protein